MPFLIMWQNIKIAILFGDEKNIRYKIFFENLSAAKNEGMSIAPILEYTPYGTIPKWIANRIPADTTDIFEYLRNTQGRIETDNIWFEVA